MTAPASLPAHDVTDLGLAAEGVRRIEWAEREMPVLRQIRARFEKELPLAGVRIGACLHVTTETANLMRTLKAGGAEVALAASNPLSTKDDVAAALTAAYGIATFARRGEDRDTYYRHLNQVTDTHPQITMDDGCDLVSLLHSERPAQVAEVLAGTEETTTGVIRLKALEAFRKHPRIRVVTIAEGFQGNASFFRYARDLGNPRGDMYEIGLWEDSIVKSGKDLMFAINIPQESVTIPETMDGIRALMGTEKDRLSATDTTNRYLGIGKWKDLA